MSVRHGNNGITKTLSWHCSNQLKEVLSVAKPSSNALQVGGPLKPLSMLTQLSVEGVGFWRTWLGRVHLISPLEETPKDQAVTIRHKPSTTLTEHIIHVNFVLFFQTLVMVAGCAQDTLSEVFWVELYSSTTVWCVWTSKAGQQNSSGALFLVQHHQLKLRESSSASPLHHRRWCFATPPVLAPWFDIQPTGADIHRFYHTDVQQRRHYCWWLQQRMSVICGGQMEATKLWAELTFDVNNHTVLCDWKNKFLASPSIRQRFTNLWSSWLQANGFDTRHTLGGAYCQIAQTALEKAKEADTALAGEDTDLPVLLLFDFQGWAPQFTSQNPQQRSGTPRPPSKRHRYWCLQRDLLCLYATGGCDTASSYLSIRRVFPSEKNEGVRCLPEPGKRNCFSLRQR